VQCSGQGQGAGDRGGRPGVACADVGIHPHPSPPHPPTLPPTHLPTRPPARPPAHPPTPTQGVVGPRNQAVHINNVMRARHVVPVASPAESAAAVFVDLGVLAHARWALALLSCLMGSRGTWTFTPALAHEVRFSQLPIYSLILTPIRVPRPALYFSCHGARARGQALLETATCSAKRADLIEPRCHECTHSVIFRVIRVQSGRASSNIGLTCSKICSPSPNFAMASQSGQNPKSNRLAIFLILYRRKQLLNRSALVKIII
jgi:hypothetical protein